MQRRQILRWNRSIQQRVRGWARHPLLGRRRFRNPSRRRVEEANERRRAALAEDDSDDEDLRIEDWPPERWDRYVAAMVHGGHSFEVDNDDEQSEEDDVMDDGVTDNDDDVDMHADDAAERSAAIAAGVVQVDRDSVVAMEVDNQDEYQIATLRHAPVAASAPNLAAAALRHDNAPIASEDAAAAPVAAAAAAPNLDDNAPIASEDAAAAPVAAAAPNLDDNALIDSDHEDDALVVAEQPDEASDLFTTAQAITNPSIN